MTASPKRMRFDAFEFNLETGELSGPDGSTRLQPKPAQVLSLLLQGNGNLVTREELQQRIWPDTQVEFDQGLNYCIRQIRSALGQEAGNGGFIETLPRRGYRVRGPVQTLTEHAPRERLGRPRRMILGLAVPIALLLAVVAGASWLNRSSERARPTAAGRVRIAVLPLASRPVDAESVQLATRLTESLVVAFTGAKEGSLAILGPASTGIYVGRELSQPAIGRELDVEYVVSGLYRAADSSLFVQMIHTETGEHLYGQRFTINRAGDDGVIAGIVDRMVADRAWSDRPGT
jgi:DNA-binding winged helix-turn-helix (wHTH) protein/TolB-like protein